MFQAIYSSLLLAVLVVGAPYWLVRMLTSGRYRKGLAGRLGLIPPHLRAFPKKEKTIWIHAVSVGEVLVAIRLIEELSAALPTATFAISTTTATGQALAKKRLPHCAVFYFPLDFRTTVRRYLNALRPSLVILMESELWPSLLAECAVRRIPVAVANARISDRSYPRYLRLRRLWRPLLAQVTLFLAQSDETASRLRTLGAPRVLTPGNIKYDARPPKHSAIADLIHEAAAGRPIVVAGSTVEGKPLHEEQIVMQAMGALWETLPNALLVLAPRHPDRFDYAYSLAMEFPTLRATELLAGKRPDQAFSVVRPDANSPDVKIILLDTIGDLAAVYAIATVAFIGGSLVPRGGHNPLEPAQFGVPVLMGPSYENFRDIVTRMREAEGIRIVQSPEELTQSLLELLTDPAAARALGQRGQSVFAAQSGATARTVAALLTLLPNPAGQGSEPPPPAPPPLSQRAPR